MKIWKISCCKEKGSKGALWWENVCFGAAATITLFFVLWECFENAFEKLNLRFSCQRIFQCFSAGHFAEKRKKEPKLFPVLFPRFFACQISVMSKVCAVPNIFRYSTQFNSQFNSVNRLQPRRKNRPLPIEPWVCCPVSVWKTPQRAFVLLRSQSGASKSATIASIWEWEP